MATISELMPYLEQGYTAADHHRHGPAYLTPKKQNGEIVFEWTAYEFEGEWAGPEVHDREYVMTWESDDWGINCHTEPRGGAEYGADNKEDIEQAIAEGRAYIAEDFQQQTQA